MITQQQLDRIGQLAAGQPVLETVVERLRSCFRDIHFTYCRDEDVVAAKPVFQERAFKLYLIDSRNPCVCFTQDMEVATGVVLAEIEEDQ